MDKVLNVAKKLLLIFITGLIVLTLLVILLSLMFAPFILLKFGVITTKFAVGLFIIIFSILIGTAYYDDI